MALSGNTDEANGYNSVAKNGAVSNVNFIKSMVCPIGSIVSWLKTFGTADSGTTDATTANKLIQSGQNFETTVDIGMIVYNTTDSTYANVTAVDSDTTLSLDTDIMATAEAYTIYKTPQLPDGWVECDGSALSDSDSPYDGETIPDLNGGIFMRGFTTSGDTGGAVSAAHTHDSPIVLNGTDIEFDSGGATGNSIVCDRYIGSSARADEANSLKTKSTTVATIPPYYNIVWIMRIK